MSLKDKVNELYEIPVFAAHKTLHDLPSKPKEIDNKVMREMHLRQISRLQGLLDKYPEDHPKHKLGNKMIQDHWVEYKKLGGTGELHGKKTDVLSKELSPIMRPSEHDECISKLDKPSLQKLYAHHATMAANHGPKTDLGARHVKLADAYRTILHSVRDKSNIR